MTAPTLHDKLTIAPILTWCVGKGAAAAVTGPFRGKDAAISYKEHVVNTMLREICVRFTHGHYSIVLPQFIDAYFKFCHKHRLTPNVVDIPNTDIKGFWIGNPDTAKYAMMYMHGGGFVVPGMLDHVKLVNKMVQWSNNRIAVFCVGYTLAPEAIYPTQLGQSVEALRYLLSLPGRSPSNLLLGGDSAGGNLVLALLSHISGHPHPKSEIVRPLEIQEPIKGAVVIAPWTSSDKERYSSMHGKPARDIISNVASQHWLALYKGGKDIPDDFYICNAHAPADWWLDTKCTDMLCTAGQNEVLLDSIVDFAEKYQKAMGSDKIRMVIGAHETHDAPLEQPMSEAKLDRLGDTVQEGAIRNWIKQVQ